MLELGGPDVVLDGRLSPDQERRYIHIGFSVPAGIEQMHIRYDYTNRISADPTVTGGNTLDIGLFDEHGIDASGPGFRGWSGSSKREFTVGAEWATPPYRPGMIGAGRWHILIGPYKIAPEGLDYHIDIWFNPGVDDPDSVNDPAPPRDRVCPEPAEPGWLRADLHCHTRFSDGDSWPLDVLIAAAEAGLDVLAITDHNSAIVPRVAGGRTNGLPFLLPGAEITTYGGHWNAWGGKGWYEFREPFDDSIQRTMDQAIADGAFVSVNHPKPYGPPWEYPNVESYHAVEVWNGPWEGRNALALAYWENLLRMGKRLIAVGGSDTHMLHGQMVNPIAPRLGQPTTWIGSDPDAPASKESILGALMAGHCFVSASPEGPQLYVSRLGGGIRLRAVSAHGAVAMVFDQSGAVAAQPLTEEDVEVFPRFNDGSMYLRAQLADASGTMLAVSNPVWRDT
jgi:hypothetical protein